MEPGSGTPPIPRPPVVKPPSAGRSSQGMLVLSYLGLLALIPLLSERNDREVRWHARNGLLLFLAFAAVSAGLGILGGVVGLFWTLQPLVSLAYLVLVVLGIVNAVSGKRFAVPGLSDLVTRL